MKPDLFELEGPVKFTTYDRDGNESGSMKPTNTIKRKLVTINWHGEVHKFWTTSANDQAALKNAVGQLADKLKMYYRFVYYYVTDPNYDRWEVK